MVFPFLNIFWENHDLVIEKVFFSLDGKAKLILYGMTNDAFAFPCWSCQIPKADFKTCKQTGKSRTISDLAFEFERIISSNAEKKDAEMYHNVVNQPLFL